MYLQHFPSYTTEKQIVEDWKDGLMLRLRLEGVYESGAEGGLFFFGFFCFFCFFCWEGGGLVGGLGGEGRAKIEEERSCFWG